ncbi:MAG: histidine kinase [Acidobacteriota bacterium]
MSRRAPTVAEPPAPSAVKPPGPDPFDDPTAPPDVDLSAPPAAARRGPLRRRRWRWLLFGAAWLLLSTLLVVPLYVPFGEFGSERVPFSKLASVFLSWCLWGLFFPLIWQLVRRWPISRRPWPRSALLYVAVGVAVALLYGTLDLVKNQIIHVVNTGDPALYLLELLPSYVFGGIEFFLLIYLVLVAGIHAVSYYEKYLDRELQASELSARLTQARLDVLRMQLHPHFLFNALNAISALMHRDVDAADRMITKLSELLRLALERDTRQLVPLRSELRILDHYLGIEKVRFGSRLRVVFEIDEPCLEAHVPNLLLQPLVENAIGHGIARRAAAGELIVRARRDGERLRLAVLDDGVGLPEGGAAAVEDGVGLGNTRARLTQLYGDGHRFVLRNRTPHGLAVELDLPFEDDSRRTGTYAVPAELVRQARQRVRPRDSARGIA